MPSDTKALIVGTAPPPRFCKRPWSCEHDLDFDFFYGSGSNWMWGILPHALNEPNALPETLSAEQCETEAANLLRRHSIWMRDVLAKIRRRKESSARDSDLEPPRDDDLADFGATIGTAPSLTAIATTSELAFEWLMQALKSQQIVDTSGRLELGAWRAFQSSRSDYGTTDFWIEKHERPVITLQPVGSGRKITVYILPSPSSRRAGLTIECKTRAYRRAFELAGIIQA